MQFKSFHVLVLPLLFPSGTSFFFFGRVCTTLSLFPFTHKHSFISLTSLLIARRKKKKKKKPLRICKDIFPIYYFETYKVTIFAVCSLNNAERACIY